MLIFVRISLNIPDDLMGEELRELGRLDDVSLDITKHIITKGLHNLRDIEECHINRMAFKCPHRVLDDEGVVAISRQEIRDCADRV